MVNHAFCCCTENLSEKLLTSSFYLGANRQFVLLLNLHRSSHQRCSVKKGILRNFVKFTGKCLWRSLFLSKKTLWHRCIPGNFVKFLRKTFLQNTSGRLLLSSTIKVILFTFYLLCFSAGLFPDLLTFAFGELFVLGAQFSKLLLSGGVLLMDFWCCCCFNMICSLVLS